MAVLGLTNWYFFCILLVTVFSFGFMYSVFAIFMEVMSYNQYKNPKDILRLILTAFLEPFVFHPFVVWSAVQGNIDLARKKNAWGEMTRTGLSQPKK
jgi:hypothetical protein